MSPRNFIANAILIFLIGSCGSVKQKQLAEAFSIKTFESQFPQPIGFVNDFENILSKQEERILTKMIHEQRAVTKDQIAIITVADIEPHEHLDDYARGLVFYWGVGEKNNRQGILIALGKDLRRIRIENGAGIVKRLTNDETLQIINDIIIPEFKQDHFFQGLKKGMEAISEQLNQKN